MIKFIFCEKATTFEKIVHLFSLTLIGMRQGGYDFWIGFCQLKFYQKFPNIFGGENWDQSG